MKIISNFRDYYDSALAYGFEDDRAYQRASESFHGSRTDERHPFTGAPAQRLPAHLQALTDWAGQCSLVDRIAHAPKHLPASTSRRFRSTPLAFGVGALAFKALWLHVVEGEALAGENHWSMGNPDEQLPPYSPAMRGQTVIYDGPAFDAATLEQWIGPWIAQAKDDKRRGHGGRHWASNPWGRTQHEGILGQIDWLENEPAPANLATLMAQALRPVAVANAGGIGIDNPRLADFQFFRALDPSSCNQEISMFVANMANPEKEDTPVADRYKIIGHGFDEASFRKQATKAATPRAPKRPHPGKRP